MDAVREGAKRVKQVWDRKQLRAGEMLADNLDITMGAQDTSTKSNAWNAEGAVRLAFTSVGGGHGKRSSRQTHRALDAICGVSEVARQACTKNIKDLFSCIAAQSVDVPWLVVFRGFDETPVTTLFSTLHSELAPIARYFWRPTPKDEMQRLTFEDMSQKYPNTNQIRFGVNELMAQTLTFAWQQDGAEFFDRVCARPAYVENTKASTLLEAFECVQPEFSVAGLLAGSSSINITVLHIQSDQAPSNLRMRLKIRMMVAEHNQKCLNERGGRGLVLLLDGWCLTHMMANIVKRCYDQAKLLNRMHSVAFASNNVHFFLCLMRTVYSIVDSELDLVKVAAVPDNDEHARHRSRLLDLTLRRPLRTRAGAGVTVAPQEEAIQSKCLQLEEMLNADWSVPRLRHLCLVDPVTKRRHCTNREDAVAKTCHVLHNSLLADLGGCLPATNKLWTYEPTMVQQGFGHAVHAILPRAAVRAFAGFDAGGEADASDDFRAEFHHKVKTAVDHLQDDRSGVLVLSSLLVSEPCDHLSLKLQHDDAASTEWSLMSLVRSDGPVQKAQSHLFSFIRPGSDHLNVAVLAWHFRATDACTEAVEEARAAVLYISAMLWAKVELVFRTYPWLLILLGDPELSHEQKLPIAVGFFNEPECNLDEGFSLWLRRTVAGPEELLKLSAMFANIGRHGCSGNMPLGNVLALVKMTGKNMGTSHPSSEMMAHAGLLTQLMKNFLDHGFEDPRREDRKSLQKAKVPVKPNRRAIQKSRRGKQHSPRPHLSYMFSRRAQLMKENPGMDRTAANAAAMIEWRAGAAPIVPKAKAKRALKHAPKKPRERCSTVRPIWFERWPLDPEILKEYVLTSTGHPGIARGCSSIRDSAKATLFVRDAGKISDADPMVLRLPCQILHPGLCMKDDEVRFGSAMAMAESVEKFFKKKGTEGAVYTMRHLDPAKTLTLWLFFRCQN